MQESGHTNPTPADMLREYRRAAIASEFNREQVALFNALSAKDRIELLFHMSFHANLIIQQLHRRIDEEQAKTGGMETIWRQNQ